MFEVKKMFEKLMNSLILLKKLSTVSTKESTTEKEEKHYEKEETRNRLYFIYRYVNVLCSCAGNKKQMWFYGYLKTPLHTNSGIYITVMAEKMTYTAYYHQYSVWNWNH